MFWFYRVYTHTRTRTHSEQFGGGTKAGPAPLMTGHFPLANTPPAGCLLCFCVSKMNVVHWSFHFSLCEAVAGVSRGGMMLRVLFIFVIS